MKINVKKIAKLANLPISPDEEEKYASQLSKVLDYIEQINRADTSKVEPTFNVSGNENVMSEDTSVDSLSEEDALSNVSKKDKGFFVTKGVFDSD